MPEALPLVTVITVTYNSARFIRDAIESILCSSYENLELIIGDDCSSDDTWVIVQTYNDKRIRAYRNEKNLGEYPNRNKAIGLAKGKYLIFIDGDDMIYPHGLDFMVRMLHAFPSCGMALMRWYKKNIFYPVEITPLQLYQGIYFGYGFNDIAFANVLFRTSSLNDVGGLSETYRNGDDYARFKIGGKSNTLLINDNLTWWRETTGQASSLLSSSIDSKISEFQLKQQFLDEKDSPLVGELRNMAKSNIKITSSKHVLNYIKRLKLKDALKLSAAVGLSFSDIGVIFSKSVVLDPFVTNTPESPLRVNLEKNPYSKPYKRL